MQDILDKIEVWACTIPLPAPLHLGMFSVLERHYVAIRVSTLGGLSADVIGHSRGSPLDVALIDILAPRMLGKDPLEISARTADFHSATVALERDGVFGRAWSLLELAFQGLRASALGLPAWQMLGGVSRQVPVQLVEGYPLPDESDEAFADRLLARVAEGYRALKIEAGSYGDREILLRRLRLVRAQASHVRLVVDFGWSLRSARENEHLLRALGELGVNWIEDPFARDAVGDYVEAGKMTRAPIGCGDEASRISDLQRLVDADALDVVRLDATTLGGYSAVIPFSRALEQRGRRVSFHEHPEIHEHCILATPSIDHVEVFPKDRCFDLRHQLCTQSVHERIRGGLLSPPVAAGLGVELDLAEVSRRAVRRGSRSLTESKSSN